MAVHGDRSRKVLLLGGAGLLLTLTALGTAAWALVRAEGERGRRRAQDAAAACSRELRVDLVRRARALTQDGRWTVLDESGAMLRPEPPRPFVPLPPISDAQAAFLIEQAVTEDAPLPRAMFQQALASEDPVARLSAAAAAVRWGLPADACYEKAAIPDSLLETRDAVWLGLLGGDPEALKRALVRVGGPDGDAAAALLIGTEPVPLPQTLRAMIRQRREGLERVAELRALFAAAPAIDAQTPARVLVERGGAAFVAVTSSPGTVEPVPGAAWWLTRMPDGSLEEVAARATRPGLRVIGPVEAADGPAVPLPGSGGFRVTATADAGGSGRLIVTGFGVASIAALLAFAAFARAVLRESRLTRLRSEFVATVGHELRTPVAVIRSSAEALALGRARHDDDRERLVSGIVRESERLSGLLGNVLDFARMEAGRRRFSFALHDVSGIVRDAVAAHGAALQRAGVAVELDLDQGAPPLPLDRDAIGAAVVNLLDNAAKFGAEEPVVVRTRSAAGEAVIEVVDRGPGVPDSEKARVFERFFRGSGGDVQDTRGTGIGLALVRHAAEAHGGRAEVIDTPGGGATFRIVLPVRAMDEVEGS